MKAFSIICVLVLALAANVSAADLALVEASALATRLAESVILDARPRKEWNAGHLPGAHSFYWEDYSRKETAGAETRILAPREMAPALARLGIDERTPVVIYGDADSSWGGEGWAAWLLSSMGHRGSIRLLNGGIQSWRERGLPLVKGPESTVPAKAHYRVDLRPQLSVAAEDLERLKGKVSLVDVRSTLEWFRGRIPGAVHIPWQEFFTGKERRPLSPAQLKKLLAGHGVDPEKPVVYYCAAGVRSSYAWLVHHLSGLPDARNFYGGMDAWKKTGR
ncbi:hypothetical protein LPW11_06040 [Geomonas sp. RF6]|uniref:sulfurtransferase n=1 Tax=Geomonas sp. RF6 TaxID=2897342 RepID=UPI001E52CFE7|nr:rhodanese-like domain-containing protein [Geomonas sp. RF6]UFS71751.1 hypothetical protein LPW11_06040 [Geomonas sp. RF6]